MPQSQLREKIEQEIDNIRAVLADGKVTTAEALTLSLTLVPTVVEVGMLIMKDTDNANSEKHDLVVGMAEEAFDAFIALDLPLWDIIEIPLDKFLSTQVKPAANKLADVLIRKFYKLNPERFGGPPAVV